MGGERERALVFGKERKWRSLGVNDEEFFAGGNAKEECVRQRKRIGKEKGRSAVCGASFLVEYENYSPITLTARSLPGSLGSGSVS